MRIRASCCAPSRRRGGIGLGLGIGMGMGIGIGIGIGLGLRAVLEEVSLRPWTKSSSSRPSSCTRTPCAAQWPSRSRRARCVPG